MRTTRGGVGDSTSATAGRGTVFAARLTIAVVLIGVPALLIAIAGNPLPTLRQVGAVLRLEPDWGDSVLLGSLLPCVAWVAWAAFAYPLVGELIRNSTGRRLPVLGPLRLQQQIAAALVATALVSGSGAGRPADALTSVAAHAAPSPSRVAPSRDRPLLTPLHEKAEARPRSASYEVRAGDTLWAIADRRLGSGDDYPAIVRASQAIMQPDGRHLSDPDLIIPGWHLAIPETDPATPATPVRPLTPPAASSSATPAASQIGGRGPAPSSAAPSAGPTRDAEPATADRDDSASRQAGPDAVGQLVTGGAIAGVLGAGLLAVLARRRRGQRDRRRRGERLPIAATGSGAAVESELREVADPDALKDVHRALLLVGDIIRETGHPLPQLFAVRVDEVQVTLYLHQAAQLREPYLSVLDDDTVWTAHRAALPRTAEHGSVALYPSLVTIGSDLDGGILLLDLEQQTTLTIASPSDERLGSAMLNALAAEAMTVPWGEDLHLSLVDVPAGLALELDPYRIHTVADIRTLSRDLRMHLADRRAALDARGIADVRAARIRADEVEAWAPYVVLIGGAQREADRTEIDALVVEYATTGLVVVQLRDEAPATATIDLESGSADYRSGSEQIPPLPFVPQLLSDRAVEEVLQIFQLVDAPGVSAMPADAPQEVVPGPAGSVSEAAPQMLVNEPGPPEVGGAAVETRPESEPETQAQTDTTAEAEMVSVPDPEIDDGRRAAPYVRILGQIDVENVEQADLLPGRGAEFLVYLLHHRQPVPGAQIQKAMWPSSYDRANNNARTLAKQVRAALGHDPEGHLWLPEGRGPTGFTLHPAIRSDWHDFTELVGEDAQTVSIERLVAALRLVRGQPLLGSDGHRGRWAWRSPLEEAVIAGVLDASEALGERALQHGDAAMTRLAAKAARFIDPLSEISWRIELRAAHARRSSADVERTVLDLYATVGAGEPDYQPDPESADLIARIRIDLSRVQR